MRFGAFISSTAVKAGLAAAGLQVLIFLVILAKIYPDFSLGGIFSVLVLTAIGGAAIYGFWLLKQSPQASYFALIVLAGLFLVIAGVVAAPTIGLFAIPGALAVIVAAVIFAVASDDRIPVWRSVLILFGTAIYLLLFAAQLYAAAYLIGL